MQRHLLVLDAPHAGDLLVELAAELRVADPRGAERVQHDVAVRVRPGDLVRRQRGDGPAQAVPADVDLRKGNRRGGLFRVRRG